MPYSLAKSPLAASDAHVRLAGIFQPNFKLCDRPWYVSVLRRSLLSSVHALTCGLSAPVDVSLISDEPCRGQQSDDL